MNVNTKLFATTFGAVYLAIGLIGFALTGFDQFTAQHGDHLLLFEINPLHNVVHLLVGLGLLGAAAAGPMAARQVSILVGTVYAVVGVFGFFLTGTDANILALNTADHFLHLGTAAAAFYAVAAERRPVHAR